MNNKKLGYILAVVLFLMWWAFFAAITNWWIGLIVGMVLTACQHFVRKSLDTLR